MDVSAPQQAAISLGSGSTCRSHFPHHRMSLTCAAAAASSVIGGER
jgi:hypothetical protein